VPAVRRSVVVFLLAAVLTACGPGGISNTATGNTATGHTATPGGTARGGADPAGLSGPVAGADCPAPSPTSPGAAESRLPVRSLCALPVEAALEWRSIVTKARQRYPQDGGAFGNYERRLPQHQRGYYREYTIATPGSRDRGARRFITGSAREVYYTGDHYGTFVVVDPNAVGR